MEETDYGSLQWTQDRLFLAIRRAANSRHGNEILDMGMVNWEAWFREHATGYQIPLIADIDAMDSFHAKLESGGNDATDT